MGGGGKGGQSRGRVKGEGEGGGGGGMSNAPTLTGIRNRIQGCEGQERGGRVKERSWQGAARQHAHARRDEEQDPACGRGEEAG